jgi:excinuclease ABC subunit C
MKNAEGTIIYVGKAKVLHNRVRSYFTGTKDAKTRSLVQDIADIEFFVTDTELEALLLESKLIKKHKPKYNIDLKENIRYSYIKITNEEYPRILSVRKVDREKDTFFGPYTDGGARKQLVFMLNRMFQLRTCKKLPKRVCLLYHIGQCTAPCEQKVSHADYMANVERAKRVLKGETKDLLKELEAEMKGFAKEQMFEQAKLRRDQILAIKKLTERQKISLQKRYNQDFVDYKIHGGKMHIQLFNVNKGIISGKRTFEFELRNSPIEDFEYFLRQYYGNPGAPQELVTSVQFPQESLLEPFLQKAAEHKVKLTNPKRGDKLAILKMLHKNLEANISFTDEILLELKERLNLQTMPSVIECFDISNLGEKFAVAAMVQFRNALPDKNNYRRFKIRYDKGQDDFAMMHEVVSRRYARLKKYDEEMPDLILIDGGPGQLGAAFEALQKLELSIPIVSIAKKEEIIHFIGEKQPLKMSRKNKGLQLLQQCRDEAHRFGLKYHRLLRSKGAFK